MSYNLQFYTKDQFTSASLSVAQLVNKNDLKQVSLNLHYDLFKGGSTEPKSLKQMLSISTPSSTVTLDEYANNDRVGLKQSYSLYGVVSLLEGIPVIGSVIAVLSCLGHLFGMFLCKERLEDASAALSKNRSNLALAQEVHTQAVDFARHDYYLQGSVLAIIPLLKPLLRLTQAAGYACGERPTKPVAKQVEQVAKPRFKRSYNTIPDPQITWPATNSPETRRGKS
jgi:hypothetical protein